MNKTETLLSALRDIQEPAAPETVSLWLLAANIALLFLLAFLFLLRRNRRLEGWRREARREIQRAKDSEGHQGVLLLAKLLRQIAIHRNHNQSVQGEAWLRELDSLFSTQWFTCEDGQIFGTALYQKNRLSPENLETISNKLLQLVNSLPAKANPTVTRS